MSNPNLSIRQEFQRTAGFILYTDVNDLLLAELGNTPPDKIEQSALRLDGYEVDSLANPAGVSLALATRHFINQLPDSDESKFWKNYSITAEDLSKTPGITFKHGFGDLDFPWHFPAVLANEVADFFVDQGKLSQEQKDNFTLHDWANIIGSGWFSRLCHLMALTTNGVYGQIGTAVGDYHKGSLYEKLTKRNFLTPGDALFDYSEQYEPIEDMTYATASLSKTAIRGLRDRLKNDRSSVGCPVARHSVLLPQNLVKTDPHVQNLIDRGAMQRVDSRSTDQDVRFTQELSAIDKTLSFFAWQLDEYAKEFGTPTVVTTGRKATLTHSFKAPVDVLRWDPQNRVAKVGAVIVSANETSRREPTPRTQHSHVQDATLQTSLFFLKG